MVEFPTDLNEILRRIDEINPKAYAQTRNYKTGAITRLGPYISRGVITPKFVYDRVLSNGYTPKECFKLLQELSWREYWQLCWENLGNEIFEPIKVENVRSYREGISKSLVTHELGVRALDEGVKKLYDSGFIHNHMRMYLASVHCNFTNCDWLIGAKWMYYHLLDGDIASNHLSWQWVTGYFGSKRYFMNQDNVNHFFNSSDSKTFLDKDYEEFPLSKTPSILEDTINLSELNLKSDLSIFRDLHSIQIEEKPTLIYNYYNMDPFWYTGEGYDNYQRVLLVEPSHFEKYPVSKKCLSFLVQLSKNIPNIKVFIGEFIELHRLLGENEIIYKSHPSQENYIGIVEERELIHPVKGEFKSFFSYWKKCLKYRKN